MSQKYLYVSIYITFAISCNKVQEGTRRSAISSQPFFKRCAIQVS